MQPLLEIALSNAATATVLAVLAAGLCRLYRRPAFAHGLWLVVLLKLVTPPLVPVPLPWFDTRGPARPDGRVVLPVVLEAADATLPQNVPAAGPGPEATTLVPLPPPAAEGPTQGSLLPSWSWLVVLVWLVGSAWAFVRVGRSMVLFRRLLRFARKADPCFQALAKELAGKLRLRRCPEVWLVPGTISPMLWALAGLPRLLIPEQLLERLDRDQLRTIFLHELAHWRRRDHWVRLLEIVVVVLYWWHPAVWWARAELREAEEQCCDAQVVGALEGVGRTYALALLETVAFLSKARLPLPMSASGIGQVPHLRRRLTMILSGQQRGSLTRAGCVGLAAFGLLGLFLLPVRGDPPVTKAPPGTVELDLDGGLELVVADGDSDMEAVELLKRALKLLAEKKKANPKPAAKAIDPEAVQKARAELEALTKQVVERRRELEHAEAKLHQARATLAALEGKPGLDRGTAKGLQLRFLTQPGAMKMKPLELQGEIKGKQIINPKEAGLRLDGKNFVFSFEGPKVAKKLQPEDLKTRLDRLLREVEELRKEIERVQPSNAPDKK